MRMLKEFDPRYLVVKGRMARYEVEHLFKELFTCRVGWLKLRKIEINENWVKIAFNYRRIWKVTPKHIRKRFNNLLVKLRKDVRNFRESWRDKIER